MNWRIFDERRDFPLRHARLKDNAADNTAAEHSSRRDRQTDNAGRPLGIGQPCADSHNHVVAVRIAATDAGESLTRQRRVATTKRVITKKVFGEAEKCAFFIEEGNARVYWVKPCFFHKDSSNGKIVSILP